MNNSHLFEKNITIDLAFNAFKNGELIDELDELGRFLLSNSDIWLDDIKCWINYIVTKHEWTCHDLVRDSTTVALGLEFIDDKRISKLNSIWRNRKESTDVLAFPLIDDSCFFPCENCVELGDIIISVTTAKRQALEHEHHLQKELRWLVSHGLLHLLGWDHPDERSLIKMLNAQEKLLNIIGNV